MRRILFLSLLAIGSGARANLEGNVFQYLVDLREDTADKDGSKKQEVYNKQFTSINDEIKRLRDTPNNAKDLQKLEDKKKDLLAEKEAASSLKSDLTGVTDIKPAAWINVTDTMSAEAKEILKVGKPAYLARVPGTPFLAIQAAKADGSVVTKVIWFPEGMKELGEDPARSFKTGNYKNTDEKIVQDLLREMNRKLGLNSQSVAKAEDLKPGHKSFDYLSSSKGPFSRTGTAIASLAGRIDDIGTAKSPGSELYLAEDEIKTMKDDSVRTSRLRDLEKMRALTAKVKAGEVKLGSSEADLCKVLVNEFGGFSKIPKTAQTDCKLFAPALAEEEEAAKLKAANKLAGKDADAEKDKKELAAKAADAEAAKRTEALIRQNMALCQAMAQRASEPMPNNQAKKTLAEIVETVFTNPKLICPTFNLVISNVAAENFDLQAGQGADFDKAIQRELGALDGMSPQQQLESISTKSERVVQEFFVTPAQKTTARGNMREAQRALNDKMENDRNQKLMTEQSCLQKMAASMASLLQLRQSMNPANEQEAAAVQQIAHYNSIANMLLSSVNKEIQLTAYSGSNVDVDPGVTGRRTSLRRGSAAEASSVRVTTPPSRRNPSTVIQQSQGVGGSTTSPRGIYGN